MPQLISLKRFILLGILYIYFKNDLLAPNLNLHNLRGGGGGGRGGGFFFFLSYKRRGGGGGFKIFFFFFFFFFFL